MYTKSTAYGRLREKKPRSFDGMVWYGMVWYGKRNSREDKMEKERKQKEGPRRKVFFNVKIAIYLLARLQANGAKRFLGAVGW